MRHCLVTGGAGFIGSHLVEELLRRDCRVTVIDDESTGTADNLAAVRDNFHFHYVQDTLANKTLLRQLLGDVDEVYHLAAAVGVQLIAAAPVHTLETNIYLTELLLMELLRRKKFGHTVKFFLASSSEVYGKNPKDRWKEDDDIVLGPTSSARWSYGASKAVDEFLALAYSSEHQMPVVIGRFFNVVGRRQTGRYGMVLPRFVEAAVRNQPLVVHDDGKQTRCFAHVSDVVAAVVELMETPQAIGRVFNIGSDECVSIGELARRVVAATKSSSPIVLQPYAEAYGPTFEDVRHRVPDLSRLERTIEARPTHDLNMIIEDVVGAYRTKSRK